MPRGSIFCHFSYFFDNVFVGCDSCSFMSNFSGLPWAEKVPWKIIKERKIALTMNPSFELAIMFRECERPWAEIIWMCGLGELRLWILVLEKCGMLRWVFIGHERRLGGSTQISNFIVRMWGNINGECKLVHDYAPPRFSFGYQCGTVEVSFSLVFLWIFLLYCVWFYFKVWVFILAMEMGHASFILFE